jgi:Flp pilus assembly protein CpaB
MTIVFIVLLAVIVWIGVLVLSIGLAQSSARGDLLVKRALTATRKRRHHRAA